MSSWGIVQRKSCTHCGGDSVFTDDGYKCVMCGRLLNPPKVDTEAILWENRMRRRARRQKWE